MASEVQHVGDSVLVHDLGNDFMTTTQLNNFLIALLVEDFNDVLNRFLNVVHRLAELVLYLIKPLEHSGQARLRANVVKWLRDATTLAIAEVVLGPARAAHAEDAVHTYICAILAFINPT